MKQLFAPVAFLLLASLVVLSAISERLFFLQLAWIGSGLVVVFIFLKFDWRSFFNHRAVVWGLYALCVLLLVLVLAAPVIRNTKSWIVIGPLTFQPVELAKIVLILVFAQFFSKRHLAIARWKTIITSFALFALPAGLTLLQPDMGSASILFGIWFGFLLVSGLPRRRLLTAALAFLVIGFLGWHFVLKDYQRQRIIGVFYPERNSLTMNYSVNQAKIAVGSAGFLGKGYKQGTQTQLGYLTEPSNDFILAALVEEWGIAAGLLAIAAFIFLIFRILRIGLMATMNFEKFFCLGTAMVFGLQFLLNAGSTLGVFPVVGVTFPFLSYGGSSLLTDFSLLAIINAIAERY